MTYRRCRRFPTTHHHRPPTRQCQPPRPPRRSSERSRVASLSSAWERCRLGTGATSSNCPGSKLLWRPLARCSSSSWRSQRLMRRLLTCCSTTPSRACWARRQHLSHTSRLTSRRSRSRRRREGMSLQRYHQRRPSCSRRCCVQGACGAARLPTLTYRYSSTCARIGRSGGRQRCRRRAFTWPRGRPRRTSGSGSSETEGQLRMSSVTRHPSVHSGSFFLFKIQVFRDDSRAPGARGAPGPPGYTCATDPCTDHAPLQCSPDADRAHDTTRHKFERVINKYTAVYNI